MNSKLILCGILLSFLYFCPILCDDKTLNEEEIQLNHNPEPDLQNSNIFDVYLNIPTCQSNKTVIFLQDPGEFPAVFRNPETKEIEIRNGGIPQKGNIDIHLKKFENDVNKLIPDVTYPGLVLIDFRLWYPIFLQNTGSLRIYRNLSLAHARRGDVPHIKGKAIKEFELKARNFLKQTLIHGKKLRKFASWAYYGLPLYSNCKGNKIYCERVKKNNKKNKLKWLEHKSDIIVPNVFEGLSSINQTDVIKERINDALDLTPNVYIYLPNSFEQLPLLEEIANNVDVYGFILSDNSNKFNTSEKCNELLSYLNKSNNTFAVYQ